MRSTIQLFIFVLALFIQNHTVCAAADNQVSIGIIQEWDTFHPVSYQTAASESLLHFIYRDVIYRDEKGIVQADLAEQVPSFKNKLAQRIVVNKKNKIKAIWTIKDKAVWSDGAPMTCADWELGWKVGLSDFVSKSEQNIYKKVEQIQFDPKSPKKCAVTYATDEWTFDRDLPPFLPSHLEKAIFDTKNTKAGEYEQSSNYFKNPTLKGLYSGPYQISDFKIGSHVIFEENPYFFGKKPSVKKIIVKHLGNTSTLKSYLLSKEINSIASIGFPPDLAIQFDSDPELKTYKVYFKSAPLYQGLFFNTQDAILKEQYIRQALTYAINKSEITKAFLSGKLNPAETIISESDPAFIKKASTYNPTKANEILEKNGWLKNSSGFREKKGQILEVVFKTSAGIKLYETIQVLICDHFKKIGVACKIKNEPPRILLGDSVPKGNFQIAMFGQNTYPDTSLKGLYHSDEIPSEKNAWAGGNIIRVSAKPLDDILVKYDQEWDAKKRTQMMKKIDQLLMEKYALVPLYHRREAFLTPKQLTGVVTGMKGTAIVFPELWKM